MTKINASIKNLFFAFFIGAATALITSYSLIADSDQTRQITSLETRIKTLELSLDEKEQDLKNARQLMSHKPANIAINNSNAAHSNKMNGEQNSENNAEQTLTEIPSSIDTLKNFETTLLNDPHSVSEKVSNLLTDNPTKEKIAIVTKGIVDMANNRESLPDYALQAIYHEQTDPDLKRVVAQVLSQRGNNALMDSQIAEEQMHLKSDQPTDRQQALTNLAKTHSSYAADVIAPLLHDPDINVKLDALLALRATGNQTHIGLAEKLLNDPEPAVSSLASDVVGSLRNLSDSARTRLTLADIASELPPLEN